ncbi:MAG: ABC transporter permease [archaeon]
MVHYFSMSFKNLKRRGLRSWLTLLGVFIGIMAVIALITLGNGLKAAVNAQFGADTTQAITVQAGGLAYGSPGSTVVNPLTKADAEAIGRLSTVEFVSPRNLEFLKQEYNNQLEFGYILSMDVGSEEEMYEVMGLKAERGRLLQPGDLGKVVIGSNKENEDKNGFDKELGIGRTFIIENKSFIVIGVLERQGSFILDNAILMYDTDLEKLVDLGDTVDIIGVKVKSPDLMEKAKEDIEKLLRERRDVKKGEENFVVSTPDALLNQVNSVLNAIQIFIILIASISIFVGAIGIVNTMATSVVERKKEIGIMKSIGARNSQIFMMFLIESGFLGLIGGILGIIFGLIIGYFGVLGINSFVGSTSTPEINFLLILFTLIGSFLIGAIAGIVPAMNAARENPVEALRG